MTATSRPSPRCDTACSFPTPARPGSGSTVGGPLPPSQPERGLPLWSTQYRAAGCRPLRSDRGRDDPRSCDIRGVTPRERLAAARLYLVCDARPRAFLDAALAGGVDVVQLRDKALADDELVAAAADFR